MAQMTSEQINAILAQLQGLGPLQVQRQAANRASVDAGGMGSGAADTYSNEALAGLLPGVRISPMQAHGYLSGDAAGFYDAPSRGYDFTQDLGDGRFLHGTIGPDGRVVGLRERSDSGGLLGRTFDKLGSVLTSPIGGPLAVLAAPFALGAAFGGAGAPAAAAPIVESTPSWVAPGAMSTGTTGAATDLLAGTSLAGSTAAPMMSYIPGMEPITAQSLLAGGAGATVANGLTAADIAAAAGQPELGLATQAPVAPQSAAAAPISASQASYTASPVKMALDAAKPYASLVGPGMSLLGAVQAPSAPQDLGPARVPGVEAPPEARGYQPASAPILDVLGRNRRENRNRTMLTGPGGVNMDSVRVGGNSLLGM